VILAGLRRQIEIGAKKGAAKFGDQFLGGVAFIAPALAPEFSVKAGGMTSPVRVMPISA
jgi:hypothetical protein